MNCLPRSQLTSYHQERASPAPTTPDNELPSKVTAHTSSKKELLPALFKLENPEQYRTTTTKVYRTPIRPRSLYFSFLRRGVESRRGLGPTLIYKLPFAVAICKGGDGYSVYRLKNKSLKRGMRSCNTGLFFLFSRAYFSCCFSPFF